VLNEPYITTALRLHPYFYAMAVCMRLLCLVLVLHPSIGVNLRSSEGTAHQFKNRIPMIVPGENTLEPGFHYSEPVGAGCQNRPTELNEYRSSPSFVVGMSSAKVSAAAQMDETPAIKFNVGGWSGFCEMGWSLCPDAKANKDYVYYAKGVGPVYARASGKTDRFYCGQNGFLKPEIASIVHNFTALQAKGEELCKTKYAEYAESAKFTGIADAMNAGIADNFDGHKSFAQAVADIAADPYSMIMDEKASNMAAAWNCALGDLACDLAYCNYAYCEKGDGSYGIMEECEGWDKVHGMPAMQAS